MTARELMGRMRNFVDQGFGDMEVKCDRRVEWAWLIVNDGKVSHIELSLLKDENDISKEVEE